MKILHITVHMGGGAGKFLQETIVYEITNKSDFRHTVLLLEAPEKSDFFDKCASAGAEVFVMTNLFGIEKLMDESDIVVLHWWHNPVMAKFLSEFPSTKIRLIIWSHLSGCNYPAIPYEFAAIPHKIFFTSKFSYENPYWSKTEKEEILSKSEVVYGLGVSETCETSREIGDDFKIIYVGTLNDAKIHKEFAEYSYEVIKKIPNAKFFILGDLDGIEKMQAKINLYGIQSNFDFVGYTNKVNKYLKEADVFGYLLNPYHYGTTENAVLEAMAVGLPVVMLNQNTEKYIVTNKFDGILVNDKYEYAKTMKYLYDNPKERAKIGSQAINTVKTKFSISANIEKMRELFLELKPMEKREFCFSKYFGNEPYQWFLAFLGEDKELFIKLLANKDDQELIKKVKNCREILKVKNKSSIIHFSDKFPQDKELKFLREIIDEN